MTPLIYRNIPRMTVINGRLIERLASKLPPLRRHPAVIQEVGNIIYNQMLIIYTAVQQVTTSEQVIKLCILFLNLYQVTYFDYGNYKFHNNCITTTKWRCPEPSTGLVLFHEHYLYYKTR